MSELNTALLISAYARGYFPMPDPDTGEMLWFHPDPRAIIPLDALHVSRSLKRRLRQHTFRLSFNEAFPAVIDACGDREDTWIDEEIKRAYTKLHKEGFAHSVEVWDGDELVGGLYGVSLAGGFFAESMFHKATDASKIALYTLVERMKERGMELLEVQFLTPHLASLGAIEIPRQDYLVKLASAMQSSATLF